MTRTRLIRALGIVALGVMLLLLFSGCSVDTPQNTFNTDGEVANKQRDIFLMAMWPAIVILIFVLGMVIVTMLRFRRTSDNQMPSQTHGNTPLELAWTIAPAVLLLVLGIPMMIVLFDLGREPDQDAFVVNVQGERFSWSFTYEDKGKPIVDEDGRPVLTVGEMFVPIDREIAINLTSIDVIHSFAVPRIAGTRDAIPSIDGDGDGTRDHVETMWIQIDEPRSYYSDDDHSLYYSGQCRELCGASHADMKIKLYAMETDDFEKWKAEKAQTASSDPAPSDQVRSED
jgi:cytochrome c oxidase subunit 2